MALTNIYDAKVIDNEDKLEWAPLVAPEARGVGIFLEAIFKGACELNHWQVLQIGKGRRHICGYQNRLNHHGRVW